MQPEEAPIEPFELRLAKTVHQAIAEAVGPGYHPDNRGDEMVVLVDGSVHSLGVVVASETMGLIDPQPRVAAPMPAWYDTVLDWLFEVFERNGADIYVHGMNALGIEFDEREVPADEEDET